MTDEEARTLYLEVGDAATTRVASLRVPEPGQLNTAIRETLAAYSGASVENAISLWRSQGIEPFGRFIENPDWAQRQWERDTRVLREAAFDPAKIRVEPDFVRSAGVPDFGVTSEESRRDNGRPFLGTLNEKSRRDVNIVIPGTFANDGGVAFEGEIQFGFTFDPTTKRWVLSRIASRGAPMGPHPTSLPPL